jgi:hypothetical protein
MFLMPIALFVLLSLSLKYIKTNNFCPLYYCRAPYWIILIIPGFTAIASKHCNWTALFYGYIYILNYNVISDGITILYFTVHMYTQYISHLALNFFPLPDIIMLSVLTTVNPFQSNFSANCILPSSYLFWVVKGWWITCNYPTVSKEKNMEKQKEYNLCYLLAKVRTSGGKVSDRLRQRASKRNKNRVGHLTSEQNWKIILSDEV